MNGSRRAYRVLHAGFVVLPILAGADKFLHVLTDWDKYLAPWIEIVAGILVAVRPRIGGFVVAVWLTGIIVNLVALPEYWDVAVRDLPTRLDPPHSPVSASRISLGGPFVQTAEPPAGAPRR